MDETLIRIIIFGAGLATVGLMIYILQKNGMLSKLIDGEYWNGGQDKMQHNDPTF